MELSQGRMSKTHGIRRSLLLPPDRIRLINYGPDHRFLDSDARSLSTDYHDTRRTWTFLCLFIGVRRLGKVDRWIT